jgi:hypothetical protein
MEVRLVGMVEARLGGRVLKGHEGSSGVRSAAFAPDVQTIVCLRLPRNSRGLVRVGTICSTVE